MKERNRNIRYSDGIIIRLKNRRIIVGKRDNEYYIEFVSVQKDKWKKKYNKDFDIIKRRCGITVTVKFMKLSVEGMDALVAGYIELQKYFP